METKMGMPKYQNQNPDAKNIETIILKAKYGNHNTDARISAPKYKNENMEMKP